MVEAGAAGCREEISVDSGAARFSMHDLVESSGLSERTIRYYITQGLIAPALGRGRARYFTPDHLEQLERAATLRAQRHSIEEIRDRLASQAVPHPATSQRWERAPLHATLELHLREDAPQAVRELARRIVELSQEWLGAEGDNGH
jgi:DNA-binding transcriptional MerR regulator